MTHAIKYMALSIIVVLMVLALYSKHFQQQDHSASHAGHIGHAVAPPAPVVAPVASKFTGYRFDSPFASGKSQSAADLEKATAAKKAAQLQLAQAKADKAAAKAAQQTKAEKAAKDAKAEKAEKAAKDAKDAKAARGTKGPFNAYSHMDSYQLPELYPTTVGQNISDIGMATESFSTTIADADHPDIVSTIAVTPDLKNQHNAYMARNAGKFLIASQKGLVEDVDQVPQYGLRTYTCFQLQEDPAARQVSGLDLNTTNCRSRQYSNRDYMGN